MKWEKIFAIHISVKDFTANGGGKGKGFTGTTIKDTWTKQGGGK